MSHDAYRESADRLRVHIDVSMSVSEIEMIAQWAASHPSHPIAADILAIYLKGKTDNVRRQQRRDENVRASDWADAAFGFSFSESMYERLWRRYAGFGFDRAAAPKAAPGQKPWREVFDLPAMTSIEAARGAYRRKSMENHQSNLDTAAKEARQLELNLAKQSAEKELL